MGDLELRAGCMPGARTNPRLRTIYKIAPFPANKEWGTGETILPPAWILEDDLWIPSLSPQLSRNACDPIYAAGEDLKQKLLQDNRAQKLGAQDEVHIPALTSKVCDLK